MILILFTLFCIFPSFFSQLHNFYTVSLSVSQFQSSRRYVSSEFVLGFSLEKKTKQNIFLWYELSGFNLITTFICIAELIVFITLYITGTYFILQLEVGSSFWLLIQHSLPDFVKFQF